MEVRYINTEGKLIEDIDTYLKNKGESGDRVKGFKILFEKFSRAEISPLKEPMQAIICNSLSLRFDIYPPLPILEWLNKALYCDYLDNLNEEDQARQSIEELLGLGLVGVKIKDQIMDERNLKIALMYHNFKYNKVRDLATMKGAADMVFERIEKNPSLLGHPVHQALGCPASERSIKRIYRNMKKKYPSKFIDLELDESKFVKK